MILPIKRKDLNAAIVPVCHVNKSIVRNLNSMDHAELFRPAAFNLARPAGGPGELATILYFSLATLTTTGYGDIVAVDPFARSFANLEAVLGQFYLAITVARLVTLELADRRR